MKLQPTIERRAAARYISGWWQRVVQLVMPHGMDWGMMASYAMVLAAIVTFVLIPRDLSPTRFYGTLLLLSALLALLALQPSAGRLLPRFKPATMLWGFLIISAALVLSAFALAIDQSWNFIPFLLFPLAGEAYSTLRRSHAFAYIAGLELGILGVIWLHGAPPQSLFFNAISTGMGFFFVVTIMQVAIGYAQQTERANGLLAELQTANAELAAARERERDLAVAEERVRLARDIHDGLGHHLTVLNVQLQAAAKLVERDPQRALTTIVTCRSVAQAAMDEVRQSVAAMRHTPLDARPLPDAIGALVRDFGMHSGIDTEFVQNGTAVPLPPSAAMTLYRAAQEGLTNAHKHARARYARATLSFDVSTVRLDVANDGTPQHASDVGGGFGLAGLRERAEQLGGSLLAAPLPEGGFRLTLSLPLPQPGSPIVAES